MSELTKQALKVENNTNFPNNNTGYITPALLREFNTDMIDSMVDEISYKQDSGSWNQQLSSLEGFTASLSTAFVSTASFNTYTASNNQKWTDLGAQSGSWITESESGSFLITASFNNGTRNLTFTKGDATTFAVNIPDVSGSAGNFVTTSSFNSYTQSNDARVSSLEANSASVNISVTNLNSATQSLFSSASLGLTTASVNLNTLTFRKGDGTTFNLTVDTGSGQAVPAGTISGSAQITGLGFVSSSVTASSLVTASISGQLLTFTKGNGTQFNLTLPTGSGGSGQAVTASYGAFSDKTTQSGSANIAYPFKFDTVDVVDGVTLSGSTGLQVNSTGVYNIQFSAQGVQGAGAGIGNIWFRQNGSDIPNSDTQFTIPSNQKFVAAWNIFATASAGDHFEIIWRSDSANTTWAFITGSGTSPNSPSVIATVNRIDVGGTADLTPLNQFSASINAYTQSNDQKVNSLIAATGSFATTGSNTFNGTQTINGGINSTGFISGSGGRFQSQLEIGDTGYFRFLSGSEFYNIQLVPGVGDMAFSRNGVSNTKVLTLAGTSGATTTFQNNQVQFQSSVNTVTFQATASFQQPVTIQSGINGNVQLTGSLFISNLANSNVAGTGSNVFIGNETFQDAANNASTLVPVSGSIMLVAKSFTSASSHLTASATNQVNLIFKSNNATADTVISGSDNILSNPGAATAGFRKYVGGNGNIYLNGSGAPSVSQSMAFPIAMVGNIATPNAGGVSLRGPASSSTWTISNNVVMGGFNVGSATAPSVNLVSGFTSNQNNIAGTLNVLANQNNLVNGVTISTTYLNGTATFALSSSAINAQSNNINDSGFTFTSNYWSGSIGRGTITFNTNNIGGATNTIWISGSASTGSVTPAISANQIFGGSNSVWIDATGTAYKDFIRNFIAGNQLVVTGSNWLTDTEGHLGSAFIGRYNANDGVRNKTRENVFVVGTGNATTRKTGFLIDSGSNTFVEGTFNVSGSSSYTGSVYGNVVSMSVSSNTASMDLSLGNYFELTSSASPLRINLSNIKSGQTTTLIVSASVSSSITFSSNVGQPSPGGYSGSAAASTDILSFVAFNGSKVNLVATKNIV